MSDYSEFFLSGRSDVMQYEMLVISHPSFSKSYYLTRNGPDGVSAGGNTWVYCPMEITPSGARSDLDFAVNILLGDVGVIAQAEIERVRDADGNLEYPSVEYMTFASNQLATPLNGPLSLTVTSFSLTRIGAAFECIPQIINRNRAGMFYTAANFPSLRGFL